MRERDIDNIIDMLDGKVSSGVGRIKVITSDDIEEGTVAAVKHHGRCDVGSPWAKGTVTNSDCIDVPAQDNEAPDIII